MAVNRRAMPASGSDVAKSSRGVAWGSLRRGGPPSSEMAFDIGRCHWPDLEEPVQGKFSQEWEPFAISSCAAASDERDCL